MNNIYDTASMLRLSQVLKIIPVSKSTWWKGCKTGRYPKPVHPSPRTTAWLKSDIEKLAEQICNHDMANE